MLSTLRALYNLSSRLFFTGLLCGLILISNVFPAMAAGGNLDRGEAKLKDIQQKTEEAKSGLSSLEEVQSKAQKGLNEVQGEADKQKMIKHTSDVEKDNSVAGKVKNIFENITNPK